MVKVVWARRGWQFWDLRRTRAAVDTAGISGFGFRVMGSGWRLESLGFGVQVMAGSQGGRRLLSPSDAKVRPMMEVVRGAVFSMLQVQSTQGSSVWCLGSLFHLHTSKAEQGEGFGIQGFWRVGGGDAMVVV